MATFSVSAHRDLGRGFPSDRDGAEPVRLQHSRGLPGRPEVRRNGRPDARSATVHSVGQRDGAEDQHRHEREPSFLGIEQLLRTFSAKTTSVTE